MAINFSNLGGGGGGGALVQKEKGFHSSSTWTVPDNVYSVELTLVGASGGSSSGTTPSGAGGYYKGLVPVVPGGVVPVTVGAAVDSGDGGDSAFGEITTTGSYYDNSDQGSVLQVTHENQEATIVNFNQPPLFPVFGSQASYQEPQSTGWGGRITDTSAFIGYMGTGGSVGSGGFYRYAKNSNTWELNYLESQSTLGQQHQYYWFSEDEPYVYRFQSAQTNSWHKALKSDLAESGWVNWSLESNFPTAFGTNNVRFTEKINDRYFIGTSVGLYYSDDGTSWSSVSPPSVGGQTYWEFSGIDYDSEAGRLWGFLTRSGYDYLAVTYSDDLGATWAVTGSNAYTTSFQNGTDWGDWVYQQSYVNGQGKRVKKLYTNGNVHTFVGLTLNSTGSVDDFQWQLASFTFDESSEVLSVQGSQYYSVAGVENSVSVVENAPYYWSEIEGRPYLTVGSTVNTIIISLLDSVSESGTITNLYDLIVWDETPGATQESTLWHSGLKGFFSFGIGNGQYHAFTPTGWAVAGTPGSNQSNPASGGAGAGPVGGINSSYGKVEAIPGGPAPDGFAGGSALRSSLVRKPGWGVINDALGNNGIVLVRWSESV